MARSQKQSQSAQTKSRAEPKTSSISSSTEDATHVSDSAIRANERKQRGKSQLVNEHENELADLLFQRYGKAPGFSGISLYVVIMLVLAGAILLTGVQTATQIQQYREDYKSLQDMKQDYQVLQIENQRLLIEQQTFSATPQIATRAVSEIGMFFPSFQDKLILQPVSSTSVPNNPANNSSQNNSNTNGKESDKNNHSISNDSITNDFVKKNTINNGEVKP